MTEAQKIEYTQALLERDPDATETLVKVLLTKAQDAILQRRFPFGWPENAAVEGKYEGLQCELAARYFFRRGAEGEVVHNENGINRTYGSPNDEDLLMNVTPKAKLI